MNQKYNTDLGLLLVRIGLGVIFLVHGLQKFMNLEQTVQFFGMIGLAAFFTYLVAAVELLGGAAMILGLFPRIAGVLLAIVMIFAIYLVKLKMGFSGGYEFDLMLLLAALGIASAGPGSYSLNKMFGAKTAM